METGWATPATIILHFRSKINKCRLNNPPKKREQKKNEEKKQNKMKERKPNARKIRRDRFFSQFLAPSLFDLVCNTNVEFMLVGREIYTVIRLKFIYTTHRSLRRNNYYLLSPFLNVIMSVGYSTDTFIYTYIYMYNCVDLQNFEMASQRIDETVWWKFIYFMYLFIYSHALMTLRGTWFLFLIWNVGLALFPTVG